MALTSLLLSLDRTAACAQRVDVALALARAHGAHITALYCVGRLDMTEGWVNWPDYRTLPPEFHERESEQASSTLESFRRKAERDGVSFETLTVDTAVDQIGNEVAMQSRYTDLTVIGQTDPKDPPMGGRHVTEYVMLASGRPALIVPHHSTRKMNVVGSRVMVAWDASREATRAVHDALPILRQAQQVEVIAVAPPKRGQRQGPSPSRDLAMHLARHQVQVEVHVLEPGQVGATETILDRVSEHGSDLLVLGGYGHGHMRELILGGVTRNVLEKMNVPVLMSH